MSIHIQEGDYCTTEEAATVAGITVRAVQNLLKRGDVPGAVQASERCWLIPLASAEGLKGRKVGKPLGWRKEKARE